MVSPTTTSVAEFSLAYDGEALAAHRMEVRDLAPALAALGELFTRVNQLVNRDEARIRFEVEATQQGSFDVNLLLTLAAVAQVTQAVLLSDPVQSAVTLKELIVGGIGVGRISLFKLFKLTGGRRLTKVSESDDSVVVRAKELEIRIPKEVALAALDGGVYRSMRAIAEPLKREGIDRVIIREGRQEVERVDKTETPEVTEPEESVVNEYVIPRQVLTVKSPVLHRTGGKWRMDDGSSVKWYSIEDEGFLRTIIEGPTKFGFEDALVARVRVIQIEDDDGRLSSQHFIEEVIEHRTQQAGQISMQMPDNP